MRPKQEIGSASGVVDRRRPIKEDWRAGWRWRRWLEGSCFTLSWIRFLGPYQLPPSLIDITLSQIMTVPWNHFWCLTTFNITQRWTMTLLEPNWTQGGVGDKCPLLGGLSSLFQIHQDILAWTQLPTWGGLCRSGGTQLPLMSKLGPALKDKCRWPICSG